MTANELLQKLIVDSGTLRETTCDRVLAGDGNRDIHTIATCFKASAEVISKAAGMGAELLITHEPMFAFGELREQARGIDLEKWRLLDETGLVVLRFHDYAHETDPDYIHAGFLDAIGLKIEHKYPRESLGVRRYVLKDTTTPIEITNLIKQKLNAETPRIVGCRDNRVKTVCLALGSIGLQQVNILMDPDCDLLIAGEVGEVNDCAYVRDMTYFGYEKSMLLLGHCTSEFAGMRLLAKKLTELGFPAEYIHCGEVYSGI
ncbi:MAG: Nif3-like dinuclear metal center hexameric protein [Clostridiaceae bacterium]|nr:Nif3-like dinuclear metal center hexameric protein [Clostridiaceae bacterium]